MSCTIRKSEHLVFLGVCVPPMREGFHPKNTHGFHPVTRVKPLFSRACIRLLVVLLYFSPCLYMRAAGLTLRDTIISTTPPPAADSVLQLRDVEIGEVVVTGTGTTHYTKYAPVLTEVISSRGLMDYASSSISDVLGMLNSAFSFSPGDMGSGMQLNGLPGKYILILVDGKRRVGDMGGQPDLHTIDLSQVERIEVVKGASSALYGSDAIAGVVNFITRKSTDRLRVRNSTRAACYGEVDQSNTLSWNLGNFGAQTRFGYERTDGWRNTRQEWYRKRLIENSVTRTVNPSSNYKISQELSYRFRNGLRLEAQGYWYERWAKRETGVPQWHLKNFYYNDMGAELRGFYTLVDRLEVKAGLSWGKYSYFYDYTQREYTDQFDEQGNRVIYWPGERVRQSSDTRWLAYARAALHLGEHHVLSGGLEYDHEILNASQRLRGGNSAWAASYSLYLQDEMRWRNWALTPGVRLVYHRAFKLEASPKVVLLYSPGDFRIRATYASGYKAPTVKELYYCYIATIMTTMKAYYGNEALKPQRSHYFSLGGEYQGRFLQCDVTVYLNRLANMISLQPIPTRPEDKLLEVEESLQYTNLTRARTYGVDVNLQASLPWGFRLGGGYSFCDAKAQDDGELYYMQYMPINGSSRHNANWNVRWKRTWGHYSLGLGLFGRYQSTRFYIERGNTKPYHLWRLNSTHSLVRYRQWNLDLNVGIDNLFNYVDRTPFGLNAGTNTPGRTYYAQLVLQFNLPKPPPGK